MTPELVVSELGARIQGRRWNGLRVLLDSHLRVTWPATGETFHGPDNFVSVQSEYPEGWSITVLRVFADGDQVVSEVEVTDASEHIFRAATFFEVRDDQVVRATEYWVTVDGDEPPEWRSAYAVQG
jgi:SnoaL-like domain